MTFTIAELISILAFSVSLLSLFSVIIWNLWKKVIENSIMLGDFKLEVAEKYVNSQRLMDMEQKMLLSEERLHSSLENLSTRIDRLLERMERKE